jgi:hypothetical protein
MGLARRALAALALAALAACSFDVRGSCQADGDCPRGARCAEAVCLGCSSDAQCGSWEACSSDHLCLSRPGSCGDDSDCVGWQACGAAHLCAPRPGRCASKSDCGPGLACSSSNSCAPSCSGPLDCPAGMVCGADQLCAAGPGTVASDCDSLQLSADAAEPLTAGKPVALSSATATFSSAEQYPGRVQILVAAKDGSAQWALEFTAPGGTLAPGDYPGAVGPSGPSAPGLFVYRLATGKSAAASCQATSGSFTVSAAGGDPRGAGLWTSFAATFEQRCDGGQHPLRGTVSFCLR